MCPYDALEAALQQGEAVKAKALESVLQNQSTDKTISGSAKGGALSRANDQVSMAAEP